MSEVKNPRRGLKVAQAIFLVVLLIGLLFNMLHYAGSGLLLTVGSTGLAATYLIMAFRAIKVNSYLAIFYFSISLGLLILLFILQRWSFSHIIPMLIITACIIAISLIAIYITHKVNRP